MMEGLSSNRSIFESMNIIRSKLQEISNQSMRNDDVLVTSNYQESFFADLDSLYPSSDFRSRCDYSQSCQSVDNIVFTIILEEYQYKDTDDIKLWLVYCLSDYINEIEKYGRLVTSSRERDRIRGQAIIPDYLYVHNLMESHGHASGGLKEPKLQTYVDIDEVLLSYWKYVEDQKCNVRILQEHLKNLVF